MERNGTSQDDSCPILCLTKTALFVLISLFVLYLPLGDPNCSESDARRQTHRSSAIICFCDTYEYFLRSIYRITDIIENVIEIIICLVLDVLYESKLRFYSLLEKLDKHDLCAAACCQNTNIEESTEPVKEKDPVSVCPCIRRKCCKKRK